MSPKLGQKLTDSPKDVTVRARMDNETIEKLDHLVAEQNSDRSKVIRKGIENQHKLPKMIISQNTEDKLYRINSFYTIKEYEKLLEKAVEEFNRIPFCRAIMYDLSINNCDREMARLLHDSMDLIGFKCSDSCAVPDIEDYKV